MLLSFSRHIQPPTPSKVCANEYISLVKKYHLFNFYQQKKKKDQLYLYLYLYLYNILDLHIKGGDWRGSNDIIGSLLAVDQRIAASDCSRLAAGYLITAQAFIISVS